MMNASRPWQLQEVTRNAPFGTANTPSTRLKLVAGRYVIVEDNEDFSRSAVPQTQIITQNSSSNVSRPPSTEQRAAYAASTSLKHHEFQLNPRTVIPPIASSKPDSQVPATDVDSRAISGQRRAQAATKSSVLPDQPVILTAEEERELQIKTVKELAGFPEERLKNIYLELAGYDRQLSGFVNFQDIGLILIKNQAYFLSSTLHTICSQYVADNHADMVSYEKVLNFIARALSQKQLRDEDLTEQFVRRSTTKSSKERQSPFNPITGQLHQYSNQDTTRLLTVLRQHLLRPNSDVMIDNISTAFQQLDRNHRDRLSREQIRAVLHANGLQLQDVILDQLIDRCGRNYGQCSWQQLIDILSQALPQDRDVQQQLPLNSTKPLPSSLPQSESSSTIAQDTHHKDDIIDQLAKQSPADDSLLSGRYDSRPVSTREQRVPSEKAVTELAPSVNTQDEVQQDQQDAVEPLRGADSDTWSERFMCLVRAMYTNDIEKSGYLSLRDTKWLTEEYNSICHLGLPDTTIQHALTRCCHSDKIQIDPYLELLLSMKQDDQN